MTFAICMIKGLPEKREATHAFLEDMFETKTLESKGVKMSQLYISFGWPDFISILEADNVELIKNAIVDLREELKNNEIKDKISTSSIICTTQKEIKEKMEKFSKL